MLVQEERDRARPANLGGEACVCVEDSATSKPRGGMCYSRRSWRRAAAIERVRWRTGGGILGTRMHQSAPRMHAFNCAVGESEGVQARTGPGGALCAGHRGIPAPNSMQPGAERLGEKPAR